MALLKRYSWLIPGVFLLGSCMTEQKWAEGCAEKFPVKESAVTVRGEIRYDTTYLQPDTLVFTDTVTVDCDTLTGTVTKYIYKEKPCPPPRSITAIQVDTVVITKENTAAIVVERRRADRAETTAARLAKGRNTWRGIALVCLLMIGAAIFSRIKGFT